MSKESTSDDVVSKRTNLFISKATPGDDAFALWLAPRLEAAGFEVFADNQRNPGDRVNQNPKINAPAEMVAVNETCLVAYKVLNSHQYAEVFTRSSIHINTQRSFKFYI